MKDIEPLIGKAYKLDYGDTDCTLNETSDVNLIFFKSDIKGACKFFQRYCYDPILLWDEHPELHNEELRKMVDKLKDCIGVLRVELQALLEYNDWLFRLAFKDIMADDCIFC